MEKAEAIYKTKLSNERNAKLATTNVALVE